MTGTAIFIGGFVLGFNLGMIVMIYMGTRNG